ncbi:N-formylglutamate amidohydrolase [Bradyrhizobium sp. LHD-71]|uniref:N-formylglutamate amidohydrolase n=1 Tax=Bradyrhizobium sp. LHD-71 TaxID=3072141 RepID=UPI00280E6A7A|nr:N-formylglutamate amidohydrolase [Bradyrhizobium sp. LHD-71]MDQ8728276.1 N-formylglutamate amidohydrolase [Bradyrhizobium sp. LHD-71]
MTQMDVLPGVFARRDPANPAPVLFEIPRSGSDYPPDFRSIASLTDLQRSVSTHVEAAYADVVDAGATWLYAFFPNAYIDANRHELDIDPDSLDGAWPQPLQPSPKSKAGIGLIPSICAGSKPIYDAKLTVEAVRSRLDRYYWPYHNEVSRLLRTFRETRGVAVHLSCHSMTSLITSGPDAGQHRSDFDLGDRNGTTCGAEMTDLVAETLSSFGYKVTRNRHFVGAESVRKHGDPSRGIHSLQIEMNRSLYMDDATRARNGRFPKVQAHLAALAERVVAFACTRTNVPN